VRLKFGLKHAEYSKHSDPAAEVGMALFTTALGLYGGVLWSGELQGFIIHEMIPTRGAPQGPIGRRAPAKHLWRHSQKQAPASSI
jgi:hypothetical protein